MVELPPLLLTANIASVMKICAQIEDASDPVVCDATRLLVAEPMALCALVITLSRAQRVGRSIQIVGLSRRFKQNLESLDILARSLNLAKVERNTGYQETHMHIVSKMNRTVTKLEIGSLPRLLR
jgi:anti-anti-sigma regulatory factor